MPVRNGEGTVSEAIESCLRQSYTHFEILIVNDHSTDHTSDILHSYAGRDQRVRVMNTQGEGGLIKALNLGIVESQGSLIARMDADDIMHPGRLQKQVNHLEGNPEVSVSSSLVKITGETVRDGFKRYESWINRLIDHEEIYRERFIESPVVHPSVMIRRKVLQELRGYQENGWAEDYDLWLRALQSGYRIEKIPEVLLTWCDSIERLTRTDNRYSEENFLRAKAYYLSKVEDVAERGVCIAGAGPIGKQMALFLKEQGVVIECFYDVKSSRTEQVIHQIPVRDAHDVPKWKEGLPVLLLALGKPEARDEGRKFLSSLGYTEGKTFYCVA